MPRNERRYSNSVFINCPFDEQYWPLFEAIVFSVLACGFMPRCSLEEADSGRIRLAKILALIKASRYAIHDLSRVELSATSSLPRFNMPFELGLDLGAKHYCATLRGKRQLVLDSEPYRYQASISDIGGQDIRVHAGSPDQAITVVRHWLVTVSRRRSIAAASTIKQDFAGFTAALPRLCDESGADRDDLQFVEYVELADIWLRTAPLAAR